MRGEPLTYGEDTLDARCQHVLVEPEGGMLVLLVKVKCLRITCDSVEKLEVHRLQ